MLCFSMGWHIEWRMTDKEAAVYHTSNATFSNCSHQHSTASISLVIASVRRVGRGNGLDPGCEDVPGGGDHPTKVRLVPSSPEKAEQAGTHTRRVPLR